MHPRFGVSCPCSTIASQSDIISLQEHDEKPQYPRFPRFTVCCPLARLEPLMTYSEQRFDGKRTFQLFSDRVVIRGSQILASDFEQTVRLESLRPDFDRTWCRSPSFISGIKLAVGSFIAVSILHSGFGMSVGTYLGGLAFVGVVTGLLLAFATRHKVEYAVFKTQAGVDTLSVARSGRQTADYDSFVQRLVQQISICGQKHETPKPAP